MIDDIKMLWKIYIYILNKCHYSIKHTYPLIVVKSGDVGSQKQHNLYTIYFS